VDRPGERPPAPRGDPAPDQLVRLGTQLRNRIHAVAADHGYDRSASYWTGPGRGWLAELDLPPVSREIITDALAVIDGLALITLPGVGEFTALVMLAEIGDITRFASARKLASWAGLTPTVHGSDRHVRHGHISKQGSVWLRGRSTRPRRPPSDPRTTPPATRRSRKSAGRNIATTAIARKLLTRAWHLLNQMQAADTGTALTRP
jgi:transposase